MTMRGFSRARLPRLWKLIYLASSILVFSYVLFELLDLDGSKFSQPQNGEAMYVVVAEEAGTTEHFWIPDGATLEAHTPDLRLEELRQSAQLQLKEVAGLSPLDSARAHGYKASLPRASI